MKWVTWDQAAITALVSAVIVVVLRRARPTRIRVAALPFFNEMVLLASTYSIWRVARELPLANDAGAIERARDIDALQQALHFPSELSLQRFVIDHDWLAQLTNGYYAVMHVPSLILFLIWLFVRHRDHYRRWRTALVLVTACCLVIRFQRVAPPRFLPDLGYIDLSTRYGLSLYGPVGTGVSDQFAAMPSIHVAWAGVVALGMMAASTSRWRVLGPVHLVITMLVVSATGHHWWLDGIVALGLLAPALAVHDVARRAFGSAVPQTDGETDRRPTVAGVKQSGVSEAAP